MLRSIKDLDNLKLLDGRRQPCGRIKDLYFDDEQWVCKHIVAALDSHRFGQRQILLAPEQMELISVEEGFAASILSGEEIAQCPPASTCPPVCKQYAALALASPGAGLLEARQIKADPHLRSARAVMNYRTNYAGDFVGILGDLIFCDETWEVRRLGIEQVIDRKKLLFHVRPQAVERFSWSTQRVVLNELRPVPLLEESWIVDAGGQIEASAAA